MSIKLIYQRGKNPNSRNGFKKGHFCYLKHHTEDTKEKIRKSKLGKHFPKLSQAKIGVKRPDMIFVNEKIRRLGLLKKEKHPNWKGGISKEPYSFEFNNELKKQIRKRDNFECRECGYSEKQLGYKLLIHHIDYNKKNNKIKNLISLCRNCHSQTNFQRSNWIDYFKNKLEKIYG